MSITDLESCIKGYEDDKQNATITNDNFCAGLLDKDACNVSTNQLKLSTVRAPLQPAVCIMYARHYKPRLVYFQPIFYCDLYCRVVSVADNSCTKQDFFFNFWA